MLTERKKSIDAGYEACATTLIDRKRLIETVHKHPRTKPSSLNPWATRPTGAPP